MVVVFFGTPAFAVPSLEALIGSRHRVAAVVSQPDRPKGRGQQLQATPTKVVALAAGIPVIQPTRIKDEAFLQQMRDLRPDLGVVVAFGRILPDALLAIPRLGMINVHASVLPRYRGAAPIQRAVLAGDAETGVTIMRVETELDAGPTFAVATLPIPADATSGDVERALAPKITKDEGAIDWTLPAAAVHNRVRGLQPWPLASTRLAGERLVLRRTGPVAGVRSTNRHIEDPVTEHARNTDLTPEQGGNADLTPGTVTRAHGDELVVACGDGTAIRVLEIQPEGRRTMTTREFLAGRGVTEGARFEP